MKNNNNLKSRQIWQFFRLMLISGSIFLFICIIIIFLIGWRYQDSIREAFAENLGKQLDAELQIGDIRLNLLRSFPLATVTLSGFSIKEKGGNQGEDKLLRAESIHLQFNLIDILKKEYNIIQLVIKNGSLRPHIDESGRQNFRFSLPASDGENQQIQFNIRHLMLTNIAIDYSDNQQGRHLGADIKNLRLSGQLNGKHSRLNASGNIHVNDLLVAETQMADIDLGLDLRLETGQAGEWIVHQGNVSWDGKHFELSGALDASGNDVLLTHVKIRSKGLEIASVVTQLPPAAKQAIMPYRPGGTLSFEASLHGPIGNGHMPHISSRFSIKNASCMLPAYDMQLNDVELQAEYVNGEARTPASSRLSISHFKAKTAENSKLKGRFNITNFINQDISLHLIAETTAAELINTVNLQQISPADGRVKLDITFAGKRSIDKGFGSDDLLQAQLAGKMEFSDMDFFLNGKKNLHYHDFSGIIHLNNNKLTAKHISGKAGNSDFVFAGTAGNLLPYLFLSDEHLFVDARMNASRIMLDELLHHSENANEEETYRLKLPERLQLTLEAGVDQLKFRRFYAENIRGTARMTGQQIYAERLDFNTMDGKVSMTGIIDARAGKHIQVNTEARLHDVNINQLFYQTGNFGQTTIVDENIHGSVTADMFFSATWSEHLRVDWESMETNAQLLIENGRLLNFEPMIALGRFIRTDELNNVSFSTIENQVSIKNRTISIPMMEVSSNVLNMHMQGEHSFDNEIDYRLRVLLSDLLSRQHRERRNPQEEYGEIIDDGLGRTTLFLRLSGTTVDPVLSYDQEGVREKLRDDIREERQNLRNILREEFSFMSRQRKDSLDIKENTRETERQLIRKQEEEGFIIEWD